MTAAAETKAGKARLARGLRGVSEAARADRAVSRLLRGPAARAVRLHAVGVDARGRRRSRHHRPVHAGRHALHHQVPLGAGCRRARRAGAVRAARPPPRLAGAVATADDRGDRAARPVQSEVLAVVPGVRRGAAGRRRLRHAGHRHRRLPRRKPRRQRAGRRHGVLRRGLPRRHAGLDRRRAVHRHRLRGLRLRQGPRLVAGLRHHGGALSQSASSRPCSRPSPHARRRSAPSTRSMPPSIRLLRVTQHGDQRVLRIPHPRDGAGRARLRHPLQILRRLRRRDDDAVRHRSGLQPQRLRRHRQGRGPRRHPDRRLCRRLRRPRLSARDEPLDRRIPADGIEPGVHGAGFGRPRATGR